jgi:hypothetical protein
VLPRPAIGSPSRRAVQEISRPSRHCVGVIKEHLAGMCRLAHCKYMCGPAHCKYRVAVDAVLEAHRAIRATYGVINHPPSKVVAARRERSERDATLSLDCDYGGCSQLCSQ